MNISQIVLMGIGTFLVLLYIIQMIRGLTYDDYVADLDSGKYPMRALYTVGFAWTASGPLALKGTLSTKMKQDAMMLYEQRFVDYYAMLMWAQGIAFAHLFLAFSFVLAGVFFKQAAVIILFGVVLSIVFIVYATQQMSMDVKNRESACESEFPEVISTLAILVNSGMTLREAWMLVGESREGELYSLMKEASENMRNGYSDSDAVFIFGRKTNSAAVKKFTSALIQSMEKGGAELSAFLAQQSSELWEERKQIMLQKGEKAATKLLLPIMLIFIGVIIVILAAAFAGTLF